MKERKDCVSRNVMSINVHFVPADKRGDVLVRTKQKTALPSGRGEQKYIDGELAGIIRQNIARTMRPMGYAEEEIERHVENYLATVNDAIALLETATAEATEDEKTFMAERLTAIMENAIHSPFTTTLVITLRAREACPQIRALLPASVKIIPCFSHLIRETRGESADLSRMRRTFRCICPQDVDAAGLLKTLQRESLIQSAYWEQRAAISAMERNRAGEIRD